MLYIWPPLWFSGQSSWVQIQRSAFYSRRYLKKSSCSGLENRNYNRRGSNALTTDAPLSEKFGTNFVDKRRSLGRYISFVNSGHVVWFFCLCYISSALEVYLLLTFNDVALQEVRHTTTCTLEQWHSTIFVNVLPDVISLQFCTPEVVGVYSS
jgi:hypothetical protein